jgi:glutamate--cysteine ligase
LRCIDLNPNSFVGISEEQIYFLDLLILYSFFTESPDISEAESNQLFKTHKTVVNEGRKIGARITTPQGDATIKEEALRVLAGMKEIADFMDKEVSEGANSKWSDTLNNQKKIIENLDLSLSGMLLNEIEDKEITFQEYGLNLSRTHKKQMDNLEIDKRHFSNSSKESLLAAKKIEEEPQVNFEVYLKDFLDKIS